MKASQRGERTWLPCHPDAWPLPPPCHPRPFSDSPFLFCRRQYTDKEVRVQPGRRLNGEKNNFLLASGLASCWCRPFQEDEPHGWPEEGNLPAPSPVRPPGTNGAVVTLGSTRGTGQLERPEHLKKGQRTRQMWPDRKNRSTPIPEAQPGRSCPSVSTVAGTIGHGSKKLSVRLRNAGGREGSPWWAGAPSGPSSD